MTISQVYRDLNIMPNLQLHQLKVAAVGHVILEKYDKELNKNHIILALLLHDMGNIIKFDLNLFPEFVETKGLDYWRGIKNQFIDEYGNNEHQATLKIANQLEVPKKVLQLIDVIGFRQALSNAKSKDFAKKICAYADMRVDPSGVVSLSERLGDLYVRYQSHYPELGDQLFRDRCGVYLAKIEQQIFALTHISPPDITEGRISGTIDELRGFKVK